MREDDDFNFKPNKNGIGEKIKDSIKSGSYNEKEKGVDLAKSERTNCPLIEQDFSTEKFPAERKIRIVDGTKLSEEENEVIRKETLSLTNKKYDRPSWDNYFMGIVDSVGKRATCGRGRSGCVITKDNRILSTGYVGAPKGADHCDDVGHLIEKTTHFGDEEPTEHCVRTVHAEQNAIAEAAKFGHSINGGTLYCTMTPCRVCAMLIVNSGIKEVVCKKRYKTATISEKIFDDAKVKIVYLEEGYQEYEK